MDAFAVYALPIQGLKVGTYRYQYSLDQAFFSLFEDSPIKDANVVVDLELDRRADMLLMDFSVAGDIPAICDRCTAPIQLPLEDDRRLIVKFGEDEGETEDEVVYIPHDASNFNVAIYLYEFTMLALPFTNAYNCEEEEKPPCNMEVLQYLESQKETDKPNPIWDALKDLNDN